ncbi:MAG TPA: lipid-A-disaccharide synthase [Candidatus Aquilonibacter sp.]|nr:lipid-A-disaccharide synthase [Candidatus Aquilonibacter sp.]
MHSSAFPVSIGCSGADTRGSIGTGIESPAAVRCRRKRRLEKYLSVVSPCVRPYNALLRILISAGEASGEMYGAQLIEALRRCARGKTAELRSAGPFDSAQGRQPGAAVPTQAVPTQAVSTQAVPTQAISTQTLEFFGVGGERMRAADCEIIVDAKDLSVVGITEILSRLPKIYRLFRKLIAEADKRKPDLAIVIDSPAFNWRVARQMKKRGVPVVYYVAPQFWAWRQGRVRLLRDYVDKALVIFPFEEQFYRDRGVDATFVGHPLADLPTPTISRKDYSAQFHLDPEKAWIALMPGSRVKEVRMNLPTMLEAVDRLNGDYEFLLPIAPTLDKSMLLSIIQKGAVRGPGITLVPGSLPALWHSRAGIIASGTATVEAAMMNTPFVMVYRVSPLTYFLGKPRVNVPHFAMVNLIAGEPVVPEFVQHDFTAAKVAAGLQEILPEGPTRNRMFDGLGLVRDKLRGTKELDTALTLRPADRAAGTILAILHKGVQCG